MWSRIVDLLHVVSKPESSCDKSDRPPQLLADLVRVNNLPKVRLAPQAIRELRRLMRHLLCLS